MKSVLTISRLVCLGIVLLANTLFVGTLATAQKTSAKHDPNAPFLSYKTFMFSSTTGARNPLVNQMIIDALERELNSRGLRKVDTGADLRVNYVAATGMNLQVADVSFGYTVNPVYSGMVPAGSAMWDVTTGTLLIDLFDNKTDRVVFRGTAKDVLQHAPSVDIVGDAKLVSKTIKGHRQNIQEVSRQKEVKVGQTFLSVKVGQTFLSVKVGQTFLSVGDS